MRRRAAPRSAQYGQACMRCAKAKCRCVGRSDGQGCERCYRLSKQCRPHESSSQRAASQHSQESDDRVAQLEDRINNLFSLLKTRADADGEDNGSRPLVGDEQQQQSRHAHFTPDLPSFSNRPTPDLGGTEISHVHVDTDIDNPVPSVSIAVQKMPNHHSPVSQATVAAPSQPIDGISVACLDTFTTRMLPRLPIIHFPETMTAEQLCRDRPLLFQTIVCVAWPFTTEKTTRATELKHALLEAAFLRRTEADIEHYLDLLLSLLTYVAWGWDHVHNRGSLSHLVMLCMSLAGEMRLDRPALKRGDHHTGSLLMEPAAASRRSLDRPQLSPEAQRAALGCFILSSAVSEYFEDVDPLAWTPQLDKILVDMSAAKVCPADLDLVYQVRLQLLLTKALRLRQMLEQQTNQETQAKPSAATILADAKVLHGEVQELRGQPSRSSRHHQLQLAHTYYVELLILETIRASTMILSSLDPPGSANGGGGGGDPMQEPIPPGCSDLSYMWQSVLAISACTSGLLSLPTPDFVGIAFLQWEQLAGCVVVLSRLESLEDSRINRAHARSVIDLPVLLDAIAEKVESTADEAGEQGLGPPGGVFTQLAAGMRAFRSHVQGFLVELSRPGPDEVSGCGGSNVVQPLYGHLNTQGPASRFWMDQLFQG
ncbi:hypothetical protein KVR01_000209 [Diaporthe batatas]|uniref:uncharacterized protein n=1 Tax=Diaporthe batatas TaxID=748121 RepID=UPI001D05C1D8|nr:uncharacterized protein KVR01_000209 [Diaporthe batatas]KAG8169464.1 hypothetical protein KVR01_000209 [Diaporthe batatas]